MNPIVVNEQIKIGLKMRVFPQKQKTIGGISPLAQKDLIQREFCPLTVAKVQKGGFHGCQRLSKSRLQTMTTVHRKFTQKEGGPVPPMGFFALFFSQKTFETGSKPPHLEGGPIFNRWGRSSKSSTTVKSYPDCNQNQFMLE